MVPGLPLGWQPVRSRLTLSEKLASCLNSLLFLVFWPKLFIAIDPATYAALELHSESLKKL